MQLVSKAREPTTTSSTVLVVEDEVLIRAMAAELLREKGYIVIEAGNADEALTILAAKLPDLVVTDVRMPGVLDGIALTAMIRETDKSLPIILTTTHLVEQAELVNSRTHFLPKPYRLEALADLIELELTNR